MPETIQDPYAPAPEPSPTAEHGSERTSGIAVASLVSALLCPAVGGLLGLTLGVAARSDIDRSGGARRGLWVANLGIAFGALNLVGSVLAFAVFTASLARPVPPPPRPRTASPAPPPTSVLPLLPPARPAPSPGPTAGNLSVDDGIIVTHVGGLTLVDLGPGIRSLESELASQQKKASAGGKRVVVWLVWQDCEPCNGVAASLTDRRMQKALAGIRLVRVDVTRFDGELRRLDIPTNPVPGFALLGPKSRPVDYVHGGEWDEDLPENIAPVLERFVRGTYTKRRHPWRGGRRDDETPI